MFLVLQLKIFNGVYGERPVATKMAWSMLRSDSFPDLMGLEGGEGECDMTVAVQVAQAWFMYRHSIRFIQLMFIGVA